MGSVQGPLLWNVIDVYYFGRFADDLLIFIAKYPDDVEVYAMGRYGWKERR